MPTRTELEQELQRTLSQAAGSVRVEDRWDDLVDRMASGDGYARLIVASPPRGRERRWKPAAVLASAFVTVMVLVGLSGLLGGRVPEADSQLLGEPAQPPEATLAEPAVVWPPAIPTVEGQTEAVWHCPEVAPQDGQPLDPAQVPDEIRYLPAGDTPVRSAWGVNGGPGCVRSPALVAVTFANEQETKVSAVVAVWVEKPTGHAWSPEPPSFQGPSATRPGDTVTSVDGFTVRHSPAGDDELEAVEIEAVGVVDGLPVWIQSSGLSPDRLLQVIAAMSANPETGTVQLSDRFDDLDVVHSRPAHAQVIDEIIWYVEGPGIGQSLEVTKNPGFNPYAKVWSVIGGFQFVQVGETTAVYGGEVGGTLRLTWEVHPGIAATVISDRLELNQVAESIIPVDASDPRIPTD